MRELFGRLLGGLALRTLRPEHGSPLASCKDIVIQDGSSFALKDALAGAFPGRFTKTDPAAVELHATFSAAADDLIAVQLAPDKEAERQFLPTAESLRDRLLLADRGYPSVDYFDELAAKGASFIIRLTRAFEPLVVAVASGGKLRALRRPAPLGVFLSQNQGRALDLDVRFRHSTHEGAFARDSPPTSSPASTGSGGKLSSRSRNGSPMRTCTASTRPTRSSQRGSSGRASAPRCSSASSHTPPSASAAA